MRRWQAVRRLRDGLDHIRLLRFWIAGEQGSRGAQEQGSRGAGEQGSRGADFASWEETQSIAPSMILKGLGRNSLRGSLVCVGLILGMVPAAGVGFPRAQAQVKPSDGSPTEPEATPIPNSGDLDLSPEIIKNSPVLQRWLRQPPNVLEDIRNEPSFRTRVRLGYSMFPSSDASGFNVGVEDLFFGRSRLTVSGDYQASGNGDRTGGGAELRYYIFPLGNYINIAPVVGYRQLETESYSTNGMQVGARLMLVPSRTGAADLALGYSRVGIGSEDSVGLTTFSVGYAVTRNLRVAADLQRQDAKDDNDNRVGIVLEFMP